MILCMNSVSGCTIHTERGRAYAGDRLLVQSATYFFEGAPSPRVSNPRVTTALCITRDGHGARAGLFRGGGSGPHASSSAFLRRYAAPACNVRVGDRLSDCSRAPEGIGQASDTQCASSRGRITLPLRHDAGVLYQRRHLGALRLVCAGVRVDRGLTPRADRGLTPRCTVSKQDGRVA